MDRKEWGFAVMGEDWRPITGPMSKYVFDTVDEAKAYRDELFPDLQVWEVTRTISKPWTGYRGPL